MFSYKPKLTSVSSTKLDAYQEVPAIFDGSTYKPDFTYTLNFQENTVFNSTNDVSFIALDNLDFSFSSSFNPTEIIVSQTLNGNPQYYQLKKSIDVISGKIDTQTFVIGAPEQFKTINLSGDNIIQVLDIFDSDGNQWYEVECLGQETILDSIKNTNINDPNSDNDVPFLLRLKKVQNRFSTRVINNNTLQIQFGVGSPLDTTEEIIPNPNNVGLGLPIKKNKLTTAFSPTNFLYTGTYGVAPSNTTLTVRYLTGGGVVSNVDANSITSIKNSTDLTFNSFGLTTSTADYIFNSFAITNPNSATGGGGADTLETIRQNTMMMAASQRRSVTADDYLIRALSMPSNFGSIFKAHIETPQIKDNQVSTIETLNLFVLSQNLNGNLNYASSTLKNNLRTYLSQNRMIGDNIEIRNAFIINIAVDFEIVVLPEFNSNEVLFKCVTSLQNYFSIDKWQINQPIIIRDIYIMLDKIKGVQTVKNVSITNQSGTTLGYSAYAYDIPIATQNKVIYPSLDPSIFEVRYPNNDIKGKVVSL